MYALWKSQGCYVEPWRADIGVGALKEDKGVLNVIVVSEWVWEGRLRFDIPRHREYFNMPFDYPRLNQFPEWFTIEKEKFYIVSLGGEDKKISATELLDGIPLSLPANGRVELKISVCSD